MSSFEPNQPDLPMDRAGEGAMSNDDRAALYVVGALSEAERAEFEGRLERGDAEARAAFEAARPAMEALMALTPAVAPPAGSAEVLAARLGIGLPSLRRPEAHAHDHDHDHLHRDNPEDERRALEPLHIVTQRDIRWKPTGLPGVRSHTLLADRAQNRRTMLLKMEPGSYIPDHDHAGIEEVLVLEGDLSIGDVRLGARDYFRTREGARHGTPRSEHGCIALVFSTYGSLTPRTKLGFAIAVVKDLLRIKGRNSA